MGWGAPKQAWKKGSWTPEEDKLLTEYVNFHGEGSWSSVSRCTGGRDHELHALWGNKWSTIARYLPGRTDNEIKNYWRTHFKKERSSQKQQKGKAQILKLKQQQQQQQSRIVQPDKDETEAAGDGGRPTEHEDRSLDVMTEETASLLDEYLMNEGLWWNQQQQVSHYQHASNCNRINIAMQTQTAVYYSYGADANNVYNGGGYFF
ncbi:Detected protein of unknown function [Hibiscus syriacus]|uniref:Uncharacterized protein n=1 Tax=Hibiscus syriacus TaxID=106335 RepID=A0A6A3BAA6_HIBSY|nr:Detected protein of unknown function [Hibiscus syriacus]